MIRRIVLALALIVPLSLWAESGNDPTAGAAGSESFSLTVVAQNIAESWVLAVEDTGFTQMSTDARLFANYQGGSSSDTLVVYVVGIDSTDKRRKEQLRVPGGGGADTTANKFKYFERAWVDTPGTDYVVIKPAGGTKLDSIQAGKVHRPITHLFTKHVGEPVLGSIDASLLSGSDTVHIEVRGYPQAHEARDLGDDYETLFRGRLTQAEPRLHEDIGRQLPNLGYVAVFSTATTNVGNASVQIRLKGTHNRGLGYGY